MAWCIGTLEVGFPISDLIVKVESLGFPTDRFGQNKTATAVVSDHSGRITVQIPQDDTISPVFVEGNVIELHGICIRDAQGRTIVRATGAQVTEESAEAILLETTASMSLQNESLWHRLYGLIVIRGSKCLLARNSGLWRGLTFPATIGRDNESEKSTALSALEEILDIDAEEIFIVNNICPVMLFNPKSSPFANHSTAKLYIAYANHAESTVNTQYNETTGTRQNQNLYEWLNYDEALRALELDSEKSALRQAYNNIRVAIQNCFTTLSFGVTFGPSEISSKELPISINLDNINEKDEAVEDTTLIKNIGVTVLSGFLGAGKTTLLNHILTNEDLGTSRMAVIVNDMSEINIDFNKIKLIYREEEMVEMTNGCICCTLREDLLQEILRLCRSNRFDYILIESTGISEPLPVAETFTFKDEITGKSLMDIATLDTMVTVVDAYAFMEDIRDQEKPSLFSRGFHATTDDNRTISDLMIDQVEFANVIVVNKCDLVDEPSLTDLECFLHRLNPSAKFIRAKHGKVSLSEIVNTRRFSLEFAKENPGWLKELRGSHVPETEEYGINSFVYKSSRPFHPGRLNDLLKTASKGPMSKVLRSKGIAWLATPEGWERSVEWSNAGHIYTFAYGQAWWDTIPREEWPDGIETVLERNWKDQYGDRHQEIVLIGVRIDKVAISSMLDTALLTSAELNSMEWKRTHQAPDFVTNPLVVVESMHQEN